MILGRRKEPWDVIEAFGKIACDEELNQSIRSCRSLPNVRYCNIFIYYKVSSCSPQSRRFTETRNVH